MEKKKAAKRSPLECRPGDLLAELRAFAAPCATSRRDVSETASARRDFILLFFFFFVLTERDATGQSGALGLPPCGTVALHHAVIQQVSRAGVGEGGAFELHCVHLVNETVRADRDGRRRRKKKTVKTSLFLF